MPLIKWKIWELIPKSSEIVLKPRKNKRNSALWLRENTLLWKVMKMLCLMRKKKINREPQETFRIESDLNLNKELLDI